MLETKEQKQYLGTIVVLIAVLVLVTSLSRPNSNPQTPAVVKKAFDYKAYLASIKVDPDASQQLLKKVIDEKDVEKEVKQSLQAGRDIEIPEVAGIKVSSASGAASVEDYMKSVAVVTGEYTNAVSQSGQGLFGAAANSEAIAMGVVKTSETKRALQGLSVPKDVIAFHKALVNVVDNYGKTLEAAQAYESNPEVDPWPELYKDYYVINNQMSVVNKQFKQLAEAYPISNIIVALEPVPASHSFIPVAQALGPTIIVGNIPEEIEKAVREGLASAFANFATQFLNKLITEIESNYKIANFLYYSDALVRGQYVNDYLKKYVASPVDQEVVKRFIPQFACGNTNQADLRQLYKAKSAEYLGFNPETISPSDPNYYGKMAKMGDFLASPNGWELYYEQIAQAAQSEAEKAADNELKSSGLKSPRDAIGTQIAQSLNAIAGSETATFIATLNLGVVNVDKVVSTIVSRVTYNLFNKFVFRGAVVYQEQNVCVPLPQLQPIIPASETGYQAPAAPPTKEQLEKQYNVINP